MTDSGRYSNIPADARNAAYSATWRAKQTKEQRRERDRRAYAQLTPEQRKAKVERCRKRAASPDGREKRRAYDLRRRAEMTPEQKDARRTYNRKKMKEYYDVVKSRERGRAYAGIALSEADAQRLLTAQGGVCGCCRRPPKPGAKSFAADHDHATGRVRGLLCILCNTGIGKLGDTIEGLEQAIQYLRNPPGLAF